MEEIKDRVDICQWGTAPLCTGRQVAPKYPPKLLIDDPKSFLNEHHPSRTPSNLLETCRRKRNLQPGCLPNLNKWEVELEHRAWKCTFAGKVSFLVSLLTPKIFHIFPDNVIISLGAGSRGQFVSAADRFKYNLKPNLLPSQCHDKVLDHNSLFPVESVEEQLGRRVDVFRTFWARTSSGPVFCGIWQHVSAGDKLPGFTNNHYVPCTEL